jgi:hypothetical protein
MSNNYRFTSPARRRCSPLPLLSFHGSQRIIKNNEKDKENEVHVSTISLDEYKNYLSNLRTNKLRIMELMMHSLDHPYESGELADAFHKYALKCIAHLEKEDQIEKKIEIDKSKDENFLFDPFTVLDPPSILHLSNFIPIKNSEETKI